MTVDRSACSDAELLAAIASGERGALDDLYARHAPWLLLRLSRRCAYPAIVEEAVQDTFMTIWRKPTGFAGTGDVGAWVWGIGIRQLLNHMRHRKTPAWHLLIRSDRVVSAEDAALVGIEHGDIAGAIGSLSPELRAVVQATVLDGLSTREAARLLGIPGGTVKTRMARARHQLREALT
jgi:RNA polymerase sigma-70 factor (ECF subfamily)